MVGSLAPVWTCMNTNRRFCPSWCRCRTPSYFRIWEALLSKRVVACRSSLRRTCWPCWKAGRAQTSSTAPEPKRRQLATERFTGFAQHNLRIEEFAADRVFSAQRVKPCSDSIGGQDFCTQTVIVGGDVVNPPHNPAQHFLVILAAAGGHFDVG